MALTSTLGSPGIEIREVDNSFRLDSSTTTTIFIPGFASMGPVEEVMTISSIGDFETIFGTPTNAAERYFYYTVKAVLDGAGQGTKVLCSRLPYGPELGDTVSNAYTMMAYPAIPVIKKKYDIFENGASTERYFDLPQYIAAEKCYQKTTTTDDEVTKIEIITESKYQEQSNETAPEGTTYTYEKLGENVLILTPKNDIANAFKIDINKKSPKLTPKSILYSIFVDNDSDFKCDKMLVDSANSADVLDSQTKISGLVNQENEYKALTIKFFNTTQTEETGQSKTEETGQSKGYLTRETKGSDFIIHYTSTIYDKNNIKVGAFCADFTFEKQDISNHIKTTVQDGEKAPSLENVEIKVIGHNGSNKLSLVYVDSHEIATTYSGQRGEDSTEENFSDDVTYLIGSPATFQISLADYYKIITGETLKWKDEPYKFTKPHDAKDEEKEKLFGYLESIGHAAFITINTSRSIINNNFEGYYVGLTDNMFVNPSDDYIYNAVENVKITTDVYDSNEENEVALLDNEQGTGDFQTLSSSRLSFYLDSNYQGSISRILTRNIASMDISSTEYDDTISLGLFKLSKSATASDILKLNYSLREKYNWSFGRTRVKSSAASTIPVSYFAENVMEGSSNISIMINPNIADKAFVDTEGRIHGKIRVYGNKLVKNLDRYEQKYLLRNVIDTTAKTSNYLNSNALVTVKVANSSIQSWRDMVAQAGLTPEFIKNTLNDEKGDYYSFQPLNSLLPFGTYTQATEKSKIIGSLPGKIERALELVENDEEYPDIDIVLEGGLGTIYMYTNHSGLAAESGSNENLLTEDGGVPGTEEDNEKPITFNENLILAGIEDMRTGRSSISESAEVAIENYRAVQNIFTNFANSMQNGGRGDTFYISDVPRGILIKGKNTKVTNLFGTQIESNAYDFGENVNHSFPTSIYYPIKHTFDSITSSYMSTYAQWVKILDNFSGEKVWIPISGYIAANMASTDAVYGPWYAAAGLRRGVINGVLDYALSPNVSQRTDLYKLCINSVPKIPNYGVTIWGIRTMSKAASAFDQNTCRRTFLYMEKKVKQTLRYYIFEPNTSYTRLQIVNDIDPFLEKIKNAGGIYNYTLTCDVTNNTPDVINNGDLAVSIAAAPTRTAENIVVEFTANKYTEEVASSESLG